MTERAPSIHVTGLTVVRGRNRVLQDFSVDVYPGEVTGLLGPSGSGKTTLMRAIVGVQIVRGGSVELLGRPAGHPELRRRVAYVTQAPSVYRDLTVDENLHYFARLLGVGRAAVDEAVATVHLDALRSATASNLSGGEIARLSLATALLHEPDVLVLDEPTVGLDPLLRRDLWQTLRGIAARGATLLVSSHVMDEAEQCDRVLLMRSGRILASDAPAVLKQRTGAADLGEAFVRLIEEADGTP